MTKSSALLMLAGTPLVYNQFDINYNTKHNIIILGLEFVNYCHIFFFFLSILDLYRILCRLACF